MAQRDGKNIPKQVMRLEKEGRGNSAMKIELTIIATGVLMFTFISGLSQADTGIYQTEYTFRMEMARDITMDTFVLVRSYAGSGSSHTEKLSPPAEISFAEKNKPRLAVRLVDNSKEKNSVETVLSFISPILFALGSATITEQAKQQMLTVLERCAGRNTPLSITGYTCGFGSKKLNDSLALQRATNIANFLKKHTYRVADINGKGKQGYVSTAPENRHLDRRVEISVSNTMQ
jgi:outer membrane protein OmpA-like peptidoglycan-associated protein